MASKEFVDVRIKPLTIKDANICEVQLPLESIVDDYTQPLNALFLPVHDDTHMRCLIECVSNLMKQIGDRMSKNQTDGMTDDKIPYNLAMFYSKLGQMMQYIINSYSWHDTEVASFDADEIKNRLESLARTL